MNTLLGAVWGAYVHARVATCFCFRAHYSTRHIRLRTEDVFHFFATTVTSFGDRNCALWTGFIIAMALVNLWTVSTGLWADTLFMAINNRATSNRRIDASFAAVAHQVFVRRLQTYTTSSSMAHGLAVVATAIFEAVASTGTDVDGFHGHGLVLVSGGPGTVSDGLFLFSFSPESLLFEGTAHSTVVVFAAVE